MILEWRMVIFRFLDIAANKGLKRRYSKYCAWYGIVDIGLIRTNYCRTKSPKIRIVYTIQIIDKY